MIARILHRYHKANEWSALEGEDAVLKKGELGIESDTGLCKLGDGETSWNNLKYSEDEGLQGFAHAYGYITKVSNNKGHRGHLARVHTGLTGKQTDRMFMYLNKTVDGVTTCELTPISIFADIRDQAEIEQL